MNILGNIQLHRVASRLQPDDAFWRIRTNDGRLYCYSLTEATSDSSAPSHLGPKIMPAIYENARKIDRRDLEMRLYGEFPMIPPADFFGWKRLPEPLSAKLVPRKDTPLSAIRDRLMQAHIPHFQRVEPKLGQASTFTQAFRGDRVTVEASFAMAAQNSTQDIWSLSALEGSLIFYLHNLEDLMSYSGWKSLREGARRFMAPFVFGSSAMKIRAPYLRSYLTLEGIPSY